MDLGVTPGDRWVRNTDIGRWIATDGHFCFVQKIALALILASNHDQASIMLFGFLNFLVECFLIVAENLCSLLAFGLGHTLHSSREALCGSIFFPLPLRVDRMGSAARAYP